ncbi:PREDICTED: hairy/enhancer-of-split related with YRPW motif protein-like [Priapulus caudatus]|uniref:Hairy/enhancer-of-split related with YRPW motif protein-like n=1 Tax=Priapulus caudatus TaxID=37621 RepID=A0ABM1DPJ7_PRICU|nr:PREDICTED: hairy/enhancer-of-split related with YRPW motif protein-like [Priapulus caudatus]
METGGWLQGLPDDDLVALSADVGSDCSSCSMPGSGNTSLEDPQQGSWNSNGGSNTCRALRCDPMPPLLPPPPPYIDDANYATLNPIGHVTAAQTPLTHAMATSLTQEYALSNHHHHHQQQQQQQQQHQHQQNQYQQQLPLVQSSPQELEASSLLPGSLYGGQDLIEGSMTMSELAPHNHDNAANQQMYFSPWHDASAVYPPPQEPSVASAHITGEHADALMTSYYGGDAKQRFQTSPPQSLSGLNTSDIENSTTIAHYQPRDVIRKRRKTMVPVDRKDDGYWEKRRKNNESAKKSREYKKDREKKFFRRACELEQENQMLRERIAELETKMISAAKDCAYANM